MLLMGQFSIRFSLRGKSVCLVQQVCRWLISLVTSVEVLLEGSLMELRNVWSRVLVMTPLIREGC